MNQVSESPLRHSYIRAEHRSPAQIEIEKSGFDEHDIYKETKEQKHEQDFHYLVSCFADSQIERLLDFLGLFHLVNALPLFINQIKP